MCTTKALGECMHPMPSGPIRGACTFVTMEACLAQAIDGLVPPMALAHTLSAESPGSSRPNEFRQMLRGIYGEDEAMRKPWLARAKGRACKRKCSAYPAMAPACATHGSDPMFEREAPDLRGPTARSLSADAELAIGY